MPLQRFRLSLSYRGAVFKVKRWFYATFYSHIPEDVREENKRVWVEFARRIIEEANTGVPLTNLPESLKYDVEPPRAGTLKESATFAS